jgi:hypothetical protein
MAPLRPATFIQPKTASGNTTDLPCERGARPAVASQETNPAGREQVHGVTWGEVIAAVSGLLGGGLIGWYGHRVARRNAQDTNRLKLTELQKQDIRWAQELIATGDPTRIEQAVDRLTALRDAGRLESEDALTVERVLWRLLQPQLELPPSPPPVKRPGLLRRTLRASLGRRDQEGNGR